MRRLYIQLCQERVLCQLRRDQVRLYILLRNDEVEASQELWLHKDEQRPFRIFQFYDVRIDEDRARRSKLYIKFILSNLDIIYRRNDANSSFRVPISAR